MPSFAGQLFPSASYDNVTLWQRSANISAFTALDWATAIQATYGTPAISGSQTNNLPISEIPRAYAGSKFNTFGDDWYHRVHILPRTLDLGNLLSIQTRTAEVWNAHFVSQLLASIAESGTAGITNSGIAAPLTFAPLESKIYTLNVDTAGPATIDGLYTFSFPTESPVLSVIGRRVVVFGHAPNWAEPITETHDWFTDIMASYGGAEQRVALREFPRRGLSYSVITQDQHQSNRLDTVLIGWQARLFALPVWTEVQVLASDLPAGALIIPCNTAGYEFAPDQLAILWRAHDQHEAVEVLSVGASSVTLKLATLSAWPAGTRFYPVRLARLPKSQKLTRYTAQNNVARFDFAIDDNPGFSAIDSATLYQGYPVLTDRPNWVDNLDQEMLRKLATLDYATGKPWQDDESGLAALLKSFGWLLRSRADIAAFRSWLYARRGAAIPFWSESQGNDLAVTRTVSLSDTQIVVRNIGYTQLINAAAHRRDIAIHTVDGDVYYRRITGATEIDASEETLGIDTALGITYTAAQITGVHFMSLCRLDSDSVQIDWRSAAIAEASLMIRGLPA
ncbi:phage protein [Sulfuriferula multivorans]|uniref:Phage protein n=1 Tax=Sulfuriferula multivorans TaxID=1559896 RepID=A0A401JF09_9PROT|nr:hypothetical protein [Sulfuriferula multivorans]GBL46211.1 phage protein [Sulfuriferula multivorans]